MDIWEIFVVDNYDEVTKLCVKITVLLEIIELDLVAIPVHNLLYIS